MITVLVEFMYLPMVLTGLATRVPSFTVEDDRSGTGYWLVTFDKQHAAALEAIPSQYIHDYASKDHEKLLQIPQPVPREAHG